MAAVTDEEDQQTSETKGGSPVKKVLLWLFMLAVVIGGSVGATLYFSGAIKPSASSQGDAHAEPADSGAGGGHGGSSGDAVYHALEPPFVVNFRDQDVIRFLQIGIEVMADDKSAVEAVKQHDAVIRNELLLLFSSQSFEDISTRQGKEKLRQQALAEVRKILEERTGKPGVKQIYFTRFVMQ